MRLDRPEMMRIDLARYSVDREQLATRHPIRASLSFGNAVSLGVVGLTTL